MQRHWSRRWSPTKDWSDDRLQPRKRGMHSIKEINRLAAKMDLLAKRVEHYEKVSAQETLKAMDPTWLVKSMEMLDIRAIPAPKPKRTSTSSTPTTCSVNNNIKAGISALIIREVVIITLSLVWIIKVIIVMLSWNILFIAMVEWLIVLIKNYMLMTRCSKI